MSVRDEPANSREVQMEQKETRATGNGQPPAGERAGQQAHLLEELKQKHRLLDEQISELESRRQLTQEEQIETATLKKRKLALRDQIELVSSRA